MALLQKYAFASDLDRLIADTAAGDSDAFARLYHETSASVYAYALSILKNSHDAEDVLHDCYLRIHTSAAAYQSDGKPLAWIMTIARNLCFKLLQQKKNTAALPFDPGDDRWDADDRLVIEACLNILSDEERQIVVLHAVSGFKHKEIAAFMEIPLATVLSKYHRALKKMKNHI